MVHVFLSRPWVPLALMVLFIFLMFLLHLLWFTTLFVFVDPQLTIPVLLNLTLLVLLLRIWLLGVLFNDVTGQGPFTPFGFRRLLRLLRHPFCQLFSPPLLPPPLGTVASAIQDVML
jgi:hypothetical protein